MPEVRVTMFQHPITVDDDEVDTLRAQGLLVEDKPELAPEPPAARVPPAQPKES